MVEVGPCTSTGTCVFVPELDVDLSRDLLLTTCEQVMIVWRIRWKIISQGLSFGGPAVLQLLQEKSSLKKEINSS